MGRSGLSSGTSWMLLTLLLWLPVLTDVLGMEWLLPRLFTLQLACSPSWTAPEREREGEGEVSLGTRALLGTKFSFTLMKIDEYI